MRTAPRATGRRTGAQRAGEAAEESAARFLAHRGLDILARNFRTRWGEIDLVAKDGATLVFVEVRLRSSARFGGAAASVDARKRRRIEAAARLYLARLGAEPPCRFDVITLGSEGDEVCAWLRGAFASA